MPLQHFFSGVYSLKWYSENLSSNPQLNLDKGSGNKSEIFNVILDKSTYVKKPSPIQFVKKSQIFVELMVSHAASLAAATCLYPDCAHAEF